MFTENPTSFYNSIYIALSILTSCLLSAIVIPNILVISFRKRLFDTPDYRKQHRGVVPRLGGVGFAPIIIFSTAIIASTLLLGYVSDVLQESSTTSIIFLTSLGALLMLYLVGLKDDLIGVTYSIKFVVQIACGTLIFISGMQINNLHGLLLLNELSFVGSYLVTIFMVVFIVNAINLIDGIDGLASGLSIIALLYYGVSFTSCGEILFSILSFTTLGTLIPFFYYNVFGSADRCKKIFMGDTGSLTIGYILCFLSIKMLSSDISPARNKFIIAFAPLIIPCFDVIRVTLYRIAKGSPPFKADRNHIHHIFLDAGLSNRMTLISILSISICFTMTTIWLSGFIDVNLLAIIIIILWIIMSFALNRLKRNRLK